MPLHKRQRLSYGSLSAAHNDRPHRNHLRTWESGNLKQTSSQGKKSVLPVLGCQCFIHTVLFPWPLVIRLTASIVPSSKLWPLDGSFNDSLRGPSRHLMIEIEFERFPPPSRTSSAKLALDLPGHPFRSIAPHDCSCIL